MRELTLFLDGRGRYMTGMSREAPGSRLTVATRGSDLALWQARAVTTALSQHHGPALSPHLLVIKTAGDAGTWAEQPAARPPLGVFTRELENALLDGRADLAVHSFKDLPTQLATGLVVGAVRARADPADLLLTRRGLVQSHDVRGIRLSVAGRIGTGSQRRSALVRRYIANAQPVAIRGNVPTRVAKLRNGEVDAVVLAAAGVGRLQLQLDDLDVWQLNPHVWTPAAAQGAIAIECRATDVATLKSLSCLDDQATREATELERAYMSAAQAGCNAAFGCLVDHAGVWLGMERPAAGWRSRRFDRPSAGGVASLSAEWESCVSALDSMTAEPAIDWICRRP